MRDSAEPDRAMVTVMFVDIVDSAKPAAKLGDRRWADLLESFYGVASGHSTAPAASAGRRLLRPSVSHIIERG